MSNYGNVMLTMVTILLMGMFMMMMVMFSTVEKGLHDSIEERYSVTTEESVTSAWNSTNE